jgi:hypothetical protein
MNAPADAIQTMIAEWQIRDVIGRYARGVDRRDGALVRNCFHPGALTHYGVFDGDVDGFVPWMLAEMRSYARTMHFQGTSIIDWPDDRLGIRAVVETYAIALHEKDDGGQGRSWVGGIRYVDRFERRTLSASLDEVWRIAERTVVGDWLRIDPTENHRRFPKQVQSSQTGRDDLIFQLLAQTFG